MTQVQNGHNQRIVDAVSGEVLQGSGTQMVAYDMTPRQPLPPSTMDIISEHATRSGADMSTIAAKMDQLTTYTGVEPTDITKYANKDLEIIGCVIDTVDEYESRKEPGVIKPGFHYALWKVGKIDGVERFDADGNHIIFKISSSQGLKLTTSLLIPVAGYCDWQDANGNSASLKIRMTIAGGRHLFRIMEK